MNRCPGDASRPESLHSFHLHSRRFRYRSRTRHAAPASVLIPGLVAVAFVTLATLPRDGRAWAQQDQGARQEQPLELRQGDRVCYIGNTLADRMQHDGWLETLVHSRFPDRKLVFRNLGFSGDEIDRRPRSANFGSPDHWLTKTEADVIFAFFGYNESFAGEAGLDSFRRKLSEFIDHTLSQRYNGQGPPRLVLFSPIAHENLNRPTLPDGSENNERLALYTRAMAEVAAEKGILFVDLFDATGEMYRRQREPLTINGIHLSPTGNRLVAEYIDRRLFGPWTARDSAEIERIRQAVVDKNFHWFSRYRTVDGYNVYGGRSTLNWHGQSNADVMQREMEIFDVMTANRDRRVWAVARGTDEPVDDSNTPPLIPVKTNKPGPLEDEKYPFLGGEEAIGKMQIADGMQVNLYASEEQFPELVNPVQMAVDTDERLWVATWPSYPHWNPKDPLKDKLIILPDEDADGKADRVIVFADQLNSVTGFEFWGGGVLVAAAPEIWFLKDTDGDDKADVKVRMLQGVSSADSHHTANSLTIGPDGGLYYSRGVFHVTNMETPTKTFRSTTSGVYRFDPRTFEVNFHFPIGPNPHGDVFDRWGYQFATDGTGGTGNYISVGKGVGAPKQWYKQRVRPVPAIGILSSSHFPEENEGNFLICNSIGVLGVLQHRVEYDGADINAVEIDPILLSSDPNFRPTDLEVGGDGALYVSDWCNPLIGHMQHNIRDPNRDHLHGRVYRVTATGRPLLKPAKMKDKPIREVLQNFYAKQNGTRYRARLELSGRDTEEVTAVVSAWAADIQPSGDADEQALLEALWVFQEHRVPNAALLRKVFRAEDPRVRAAAIRTLGDWRTGVEDWESLLLSAARDPEPLVRAAAVVAATEFEGLAAAEAIFEAANRPTDVQLDFVLNYARRKIAVDRLVQDALRSGKPLSPAAQQYVLGNASIEDLLKLERTEAVYRTILARGDARESQLREAVAGLARMRGIGELDVLLEVIPGLDEQDGAAASLAAVGKLLVARPPAELKGASERLRKLVAEGAKSATRKAGYAAWITADGNADAAFRFARQDGPRLRELLESVDGISDPSARDSLYGHVRGLLTSLPEGIETSASDSPAESGIRVDYFHPSASNVAIETLAAMVPKASGIVPRIEIDVPQRQQQDQFALRFTGRLHVERAGNYRFFIRSDDGSRVYLGGELLIDHDGLHGMSEKSAEVRLEAGAHPLVVTYFDNGGSDGLNVSWSGPGFRRRRIPSSRLSPGGSDSIQDVAIRALMSIPGHEPEKFLDLVALIKTGRNLDSAVRALRELPDQHWAAGEIRPLVDTLLAHLSDMPARYRTGPAALDATGLTKELAAKLPADQARAVESRLANLDVRVIALGTVAHRMIYDKAVIAVQAGRPVEFRFSNTDDMPHNFAVALPGSLEEVGLLAEETSREPDAMARNYIPQTDKILRASRLLQPGQSQAISFDVPDQPGVYPYVCTYPGHWRRMYGALYVVENLEQYESNPDDYLAAHPLPVRDELLNYLSRDTEWKYEDLVGQLDALRHGRSFEVGRQLFTVAACVSCHKLDGEGQEIGPDLTQLDQKFQPTDILAELIDPSKRINEKYQSYSLELDSGKVVSGLIVQETDDSVTVAVNPVAGAEPTVIPSDSIERRTKLTTSLMPSGLLNKLTQEEILDLIAYVFARGNKKHPLYADGHEHEH